MTAPAWLDELNLERGAPWVSMGTRSLSDEGLLVRDDDFERDLALKAELLAQRHDEVFAALDTPAVRAASAEVLALVGGAPDPQMHPLDAAGRLVQEDLCVLVLRDGAPHLDAASLCFPSYWRLADKLGRPLADVHGPVPHYAAELAAKVDGFLRRLSARRMVWRRNWSIHDDPTYFLPNPALLVSPERQDLNLVTQEAFVSEPGPGSGDLYLRSERQVLRRLDTPGTVLFSIRTQQVRLAVLAERPDIAQRMATAIAAWSPELAAYKGGHGAARAGAWLATL